MANLARAFDILAGQAGRVIERDVQMKQRRQQMIDMLLAEQQHKTFLKNMELQRKEDAALKRQRLAGDLADERQTRADQAAYDRQTRDIQAKKDVAKIRADATKARGARSGKIYVNPYTDTILDIASAKYNQLMKLKYGVQGPLNQRIWDTLDETTKKRIDDELFIARSRRDWAIKKFGLEVGMPVYKSKPEPTNGKNKKTIPGF